jgi:hypothetical protein
MRVVDQRGIAFAGGLAAQPVAGQEPVERLGVGVGHGAGRVVGRQHAQQRAPQLLDLGGVGADDHAVVNRCGARGGRALVAVDGDDAEAAGSAGRQARVGAQGGDVDACLGGRPEDRAAVGDRDLATVDGHPRH